MKRKVWRSFLLLVVVLSALATLWGGTTLLTGCGGDCLGAGARCSSVFLAGTEDEGLECCDGFSCTTGSASGYATCR